MDIRSKSFPDYVLVGDSICKNLEIKNLTITAYPGAKLKIIKVIADVMCHLPEKAFILQGGINDIVSRTNEFRDPIKVK